MYRSIVKIEGICRPEIYLTPRQLVLFAFNTRGYTSSSSPSNTNNPPEKPVETTHSNSNSNSNAHALNNPIPSYPWLLSSSLPRIKKLTLWERLKQYHFKQVGIERTKEHLQDKVYPFPEQFQEDASKVVLELFSRLNGNRSAISQISTDTSQSGNCIVLYFIISYVDYLLNMKFFPRILRIEFFFCYSRYIK